MARKQKQEIATDDGRDGVSGTFTVPDADKTAILAELSEGYDGSYGLDRIKTRGVMAFGAPYDRDVSILLAHVVAAGSEPGCVFTRLTNPGIRTDWAKWGSPSPDGPVSGIIPDASNPGRFRLVAPDGTPLETTDSPDGFPDENVKTECREHFAALNAKGKVRYLARLRALGTDPATFGLPVNVA